MKLIGIYCFFWHLSPLFGQCPKLYNVPCFGIDYNPGKTPEILNTTEDRIASLMGWEALEELDLSIQRSCATTGLKFPTLVMIWQKDQAGPGYCSITRICNETACMELGSPSTLFAEEVFVPAESLENLLNHEETLVLRIKKTEIVKRHNTSVHPIHTTKKKLIHDELRRRRRNSTCNPITISPSDIWDDPFQEISSDLKSWKSNAEYFQRQFCRIRDVNDFTFHLNGSLDFFCSRLVICSYKKCLVYYNTAQKYARIFPTSSCSTNAFPDLPICSAIKLDSWSFGRRNRRRPLNYPIGLFHIPFSKYCGAGTDVIHEDDTGGPTGELDQACRLHDIAYMLGEDPTEADDQLLQNVWATGSPYYYVFWLAIKTKQAFEAITGKTYTSSLYVTPVGTAATFAHYFYFKSVFDGFEANGTHLDIIREKELTWRNAVLDIWRGQCYVQKRPGSDVETGGGAPLDVRPSTSQFNPLDTRKSGSSRYSEDDTSVTVQSDYPPPPQFMQPCRVVINEVLTDDGLTSESFIELLKVCPPEDNKRHRVVTLKSYYLAVIRASDPVTLQVFIDLGTRNLVIVEEKEETGHTLRSVSKYYFVVGSTNVKEKNLNLYHTPGGKNGIPSGTNNDNTYSVVLLHSESLKKSSKYKGSLPISLTTEDIEGFGIAMQDIVTYGAPCSRARCSVFMKWNLGLLQLDEDTNIEPIPDQTDTKEQLSINRCSKNANPMQQESWEMSTPSPLRKNKCSVRVDPLYTFKRGPAIQSSAQHVIMNVKNFFHSYLQEPTGGLLDGSELELTSRATGVSTRTVKSINSRHLAGTIQTPRGRKRKRISRAICRFLEEDKQFIKDYIQSKYKSNLPPFLDDVFTKTQQHFTNQDPPRVMCGKSTFRKILYMMGFHYGRIDALLVLLERPDIVMKRGVYLRQMKANDQSPNPKPVIYTDESWIDPHARSGKAWVPKERLFGHEERLKYTYQKHHTNRGKRIIMIHAAGPDGLIHENEAVFEVGGSKLAGEKERSNAEDYHDNIDSTFYFDWFRKLCINVKRIYGEAIIVIDNAPYHTKSDAPKSGGKKKEFENYLHQVDGEGKLTGFDKTKKYLRWQLWQMVLQYKNENSNHYIIDRLAMEYGHTVIRLPPHQCNFNPIEMLWFQGKEKVRQSNTDQKIDSVKAVIKEFFLMFPAEEWRKLVEHTDKLREEYWKTDKLYDEFLDAHEERIHEDPDTSNAERSSTDSTGDIEYGPLDSYMHAGTEIRFDDNGDLVEAQRTDEET